MTVDRDDAAASLREIASVERRTREALVYAASSSILIMWGVLVTIGYALNHLYPRQAGTTWLVINIFGLGVCVFARLVVGRANPQSVWDRRITYALLVLVAYGVVWSILLAPFGGREMGAFWPTLFMFGYVVAGLWLGRFFIICGATVTALTLIGFFWLGPWFYLWMAIVSGGGLIAGGLWLRRVGLRP
jgi:hypothetical protein